MRGHYDEPAKWAVCRKLITTPRSVVTHVNGMVRLHVCAEYT